MTFLRVVRGQVARRDPRRRRKRIRIGSAMESDQAIAGAEWGRVEEARRVQVVPPNLEIGDEPRVCITVARRPEYRETTLAQQLVVGGIRPHR